MRKAGKHVQADRADHHDERGQDILAGQLALAFRLSPQEEYELTKEQTSRFIEAEVLSLAALWEITTLRQGLVQAVQDSLKASVKAGPGEGGEGGLDTALN